LPWFRLDDSFHSHPKVIAAGNEAIGFYVRCGAYAAQHLTDGFIRQDVALLYGSPALADSLVQAKLWRRVRGGWQMPDYLDYNPSAEQVKQERKNAAERQKRRRDALMSRRDSQGDSRVSHRTPTRPYPYPPKPPVSAGPTPIPPPVTEVARVNGKPARGPTVHAIAAQARTAITREGTHD